MLAQVAAHAAEEDFWRHPAVLVVLAAVLALLTGLLWRVLDNQRRAREGAEQRHGQVVAEVQRVATELREHMAREDETNEDVDARIGQLVTGQREVRAEMRDAVRELRGDVRAVHKRLDLVLSGAPEAREHLWRQDPDRDRRAE